jgi:hypothetical protein
VLKNPIGDSNLFGSILRRPADTDEAGHAFQYEAGHRFRFEAGRGSDLMSATWRLLPRIEGMMFGLAGLVKLGWILASAN